MKRSRSRTFKFAGVDEIEISPESIISFDTVNMARDIDGTYNLPRCTPLSELRETIARQKNISKDRVKLFTKDDHKLLSNDRRTLDSYGIVNGTQLNIIIADDDVYVMGARQCWSADPNILFKAPDIFKEIYYNYKDKIVTDDYKEESQVINNKTFNLRVGVNGSVCVSCPEFTYLIFHDLATMHATFKENELYITRTDSNTEISGIYQVFPANEFQIMAIQLAESECSNNQKECKVNAKGRIYTVTKKDDKWFLKTETNVNYVLFSASNPIQY